MQPITPCIWFDHTAEEAVNFYKTVFKNVSTGKTVRYDEASSKASGMPAGSVLTVEFTIEGFNFLGLNGGPMFKITPALSFFVHCASVEETNDLWAKLMDGGEAMIEIGEFPYSKRYGWLKDKFGVTWQLMAVDQPITQKIVPAFLFTGKNFGKAEEAVNQYVSVFPDSKLNMMSKAGAAPHYDNPDAVMFCSFTLRGVNFAAMDGPGEHAFTFSEGVSLMIDCDTQEEIDHYWALSADPASEQCGWLKDTFGVSWQVVPRTLGDMLYDKDPAKAKRVMAAMLEMKKIDIAGLRKAYDGA